MESLNRALNIILKSTPSVETYEMNSTINLKLHSKKLLFARYIVHEHKNGRLGAFGELESIVNRKTQPSSNVIEQPPKEEESISFSDFCQKKVGDYVNSKNLQTPIGVTAHDGKPWPPPLPKIPNSNIRHTVFTHKSIGRLYVANTPEEQIEVHNERYEFLGDSIVNSMFAIIAYEKLPTVDEGDLTACRRQLISNNTLSEWAKMYGLDKELRIDKRFSSMNRYVVGGTNQNSTTPKYIADVFEAYVGGLWVYYTEAYNSAKAFDIVKPWLESLSEPFFETIYAAGKFKPAPREAAPASSSTQLPGSRSTTGNTMGKSKQIPVVPVWIEDSDSEGDSASTNVKATSKINSSDPASSKPAKGDQSSSPISVSSLGSLVKNSSVDVVRLYDNRETNMNAKSDLYSKIGRANMRPSYTTEKVESNGYYTVACRMGNEILATASGRNLKIAGNLAAMAVLDNKDIIERYAAIRRSLPFEDKGSSSSPAPKDSKGGINGNNGDDGDDDFEIINYSKSDKKMKDENSVIILNSPPSSSNKIDHVSDDDYQPEFVLKNKPKSKSKSGSTTSTASSENVSVISNSSNLTPEVIKKYTDAPVQSLETHLKPIEDKVRYDFENGDGKWNCTFIVNNIPISTGKGSSKKRAKKRASLYALLKHQDALNDHLKGTSSHVI